MKDLDEMTAIEVAKMRYPDAPYPSHDYFARGSEFQKHKDSQELAKWQKRCEGLVSALRELKYERSRSNLSGKDPLTEMVDFCLARLAAYETDLKEEK